MDEMSLGLQQTRFSIGTSFGSLLDRGVDFPKPSLFWWCTDTTWCFGLLADQRMDILVDQCFGWEIWILRRERPLSFVALIWSLVGQRVGPAEGYIGKFCPPELRGPSLLLASVGWPACKLTFPGLLCSTSPANRRTGEGEGRREGDRWQELKREGWMEFWNGVMGKGRMRR